MQTIQITDDIYDHLLRNTSYLEEGASSILRRLLKLPASESPQPSQSPTPAGEEQVGVRQSVSKFLAGSRLQIERDAVQRFLIILSWLHEQHPQEFGGVLHIEGRKRLYFATNAAALENSGSSVFPKQIPGTGFWVVTNNDTPKKKRILEDVLRMLHFSPGESRTLVAVVG